MKLRFLWVLPVILMCWTLLSCASKQQYIEPVPQTLGQVTQTYVSSLIPSGGLAWLEWNRGEDIPADELIQFCAYNNLLNLPITPEGLTIAQGGEYVDHTGPAYQVEAAIKQYFDVPSKHLRTSSLYQFLDPHTMMQYKDAYMLPDGFGGGLTTRALDYRQDGAVLTITVGLFWPEDSPDAPSQTSELTVKLDRKGFKYLSNRFILDQ